MSIDPMTAPPRLDRFLTYRLHRVARLSDRDTGAAYLATIGLVTGEARCLAAIGAYEPLSINELAQRANQDKGQASRSTTALVGRGLVAKATSPEDGRGVVLTLTKKGRVLYAKAMGLIADRNAATFAALNAAERRLLGELLDRVALSLDVDP